MVWLNPVLDPEFAKTVIAVRTRTGTGPRGGTYATAVERTVIADDERRQVRDQNGELVVSETTVLDLLDAVDLYSVGSEVTVNDRTTRVVAVKRNMLGDPAVDNLEVNLA